MKICVLGDLHFRTDLWWGGVAESFLSWFEKAEVGGILIQAGDVTDKDVNPGDTVDLVYRFAQICASKFEHTYILVGNHDRKLYKGRDQYSFKFLKRMDGITVIEEPKIYDLHGVKTAMIPFVRTRGMTVDEYYESNLPKEFYSEEFDILVGHLAVKEKGTYYGGIDISKMKSKNYALGHIHSRPQASKFAKLYTGSIAPCKVDEDLTGDQPRCIKIFEDAVLTEEVSIPRFMTYDSVTFPKEIPKTSDGLIHVYTVKGCKNLALARGFYKESHIRGVEKSKKSDVEVSVGERGKAFGSTREAFSSMLKETGMKISRPVHKYVSDLLDL